MLIFFILRWAILILTYKYEPLFQEVSGPPLITCVQLLAEPSKYRPLCTWSGDCYSSVMNCKKSSTRLFIGLNSSMGRASGQSSEGPGFDSPQERQVFSKKGSGGLQEMWVCVQARLKNGVLDLKNFDSTPEDPGSNPGLVHIFS